MRQAKCFVCVTLSSGISVVSANESLARDPLLKMQKSWW